MYNRSAEPPHHAEERAQAHSHVHQSGNVEVGPRGKTINDENASRTETQTQDETMRSVGSPKTKESKESGQTSRRRSIVGEKSSVTEHIRSTPAVKLDQHTPTEDDVPDIPPDLPIPPHPPDELPARQNKPKY